MQCNTGFSAGGAAPTEVGAAVISVIAIYSPFGYYATARNAGRGTRRVAMAVQH